MALWLFVILILCSASFVLYLTYGPLRRAPNVASLRLVAAVQYLAAVVLAVARLLGKA
ncbi:hypothetical protein [Deinococcus aquiradiocola]|uniref:Uncharacterized protein n=1 Tax=Deinococcus aquiradiocola TaxID=393059 RepID=A0A917P5Y4_9DEIO|nr:hypothetical protein [Deinococcus aquiradiocola]GGJ63364.1 hypothetical protein GCM10008939_04090 [Deinococcus aquiradiocola]